MAPLVQEVWSWAWGALPPPEWSFPMLAAALAVSLVSLARRATLGDDAPPPLAEAEGALRHAGRPMLRLLGGALCLIGGLFGAIAAEAATLDSLSSPTGLLLGAAVFGAAGLRCLWLARAR